MKIGESKVKLVLDCLGITNYVYDEPLDCLGDRRPDFVLKDYKIAIEYQGPRHFIDGFYGDPIWKVNKEDQEKYKILVDNGYSVIYAAFPKIDTKLEGQLPETYIDTLCTTEEELKSLLMEKTNKIPSGRVLHKLYHFSDLSFGKLCSVNRKITGSHVNDIFRSLDLDDTWDELGVIIVDLDTNEIVDGNHRLKALEKYIEKHGKLKEPIDVMYYKRKPGETLAEAIMKHNRGRKPLTSSDYTDLTEKRGNTAITTIKDFGKTHDLTKKLNSKGKEVGSGWNETITYGIIYGKGMKTEIMNNTISISKQEIIDSEVRHEQLKNIITALGLTINKAPTPLLRSIVYSWFDLTVKNELFKTNFSKITIDEFCDQVKVEPKSESIAEMLDKNTWTNFFNSVLNNCVINKTDDGRIY